MRANVDGSKWCPKCKTMLRVDDFGPSKVLVDGLTSWCRKCRRENERLRTQKPDVKEKIRQQYNARRSRPDILEKERARSRARYHANSDVFKKRHRREKLKREFGITVEQWESLFATQGGRCAICDTDDFKGKRPHTDHCHVTGEVRGLLCKRCNQGVGFFVDDPRLMRAAADYIEQRTAQKRVA